MKSFRTQAPYRTSESNPLSGLISRDAANIIRNRLRTDKLGAVADIVATDLDFTDRKNDGFISKDAFLSKLEAYVGWSNDDPKAVETLQACHLKVERSAKDYLPVAEVAECIAPVVHRAITQQIDPKRGK